MKLRFRKKSQAEWVTLFVLVMPFCFFLLTQLLHLPTLLKYTIDIGWIFLLALLVLKQRRLPNIQAIELLQVVGAFYICSLIGFGFHYISGAYYLWGLRNNIRFFVFFFACICFLNNRSIEHCFAFLNKVYWINVPVVLYQYLVMGKGQDNLGGIFGVGRGCNGYTNIFLLIVVTFSVLRYLHYEEKLSECLVKCAVAMMIAALSELKMFFLELVLVALMAMVLTRFSFRKLLISVAIAAGIIAGIRLLVYVFPMYDDFFTMEGILKVTASKRGYASSNDISRMTAVSFALDRFLPTRMDKLFGLGLGNCDFASFDFLITPFYRQYGNLNYMWFSSAFLVLETGLVGLALYGAFFVYLFFAAGKRKQEGSAPDIYCQLAQIMSVICLVLIVYNGSLRTEAAFMMYFVLAVPFIPWDKQITINSHEKCINKTTKQMRRHRFEIK